MSTLYHFRCPRCGLTDEHVGPAREAEDRCGVCSTASGLPVKLERRPVEDRDMSAADLTLLLRSRTFPVSTEGALQEEVGRALRVWGRQYDREYRLSPRDRIDFFVADGIGIETKIKCGKRAIFRQLERYAGHEDIRELILVTATALGLPPAINGKPLYHVSLGRAAL